MRRDGGGAAGRGVASVARRGAELQGTRPVSGQSGWAKKARVVANEAALGVLRMHAEPTNHTPVGVSARATEEWCLAYTTRHRHSVSSITPQHAACPTCTGVGTWGA